MAQSEYSSPWSNAVATADMLNAFQTATATLTKYTNVFLVPFITSMNNFFGKECHRVWTRSPLENLLAYIKLEQMNLTLTGLSINGSSQAVGQFIQKELQNVLPALAAGDCEVYSRFAQRMDKLVRGAAHTYPEAIDGIGSEFGFHFERQPLDSKMDETERFELYQVLPTDIKVTVRQDAKPLLIVPPVVLGANILSFLPAEQRSYAHAYANLGIPTYIRLYKDIKTSEAMQLLTPEDDAKDTRRFCELLYKRHQAPVTLNGYCQGGYAVLCDMLSGELDDLVDALITCVAPMDGTRSKGLTEFLNLLPTVFNDLAYGVKTLPNGNRVVDGMLMGWIYKLKNIEMETPLLAMWRDMMLASHTNGDPSAISKTAAALNHWLLYERNDFPLGITKASFASYNTPITKDGTLPIKMFGRELNLKRLEAKKIKWLICYGLQDDLVEPEAALAPLDYVNADVTAFPKGHVAIATSWSHPESAYALHKRYEKENSVGPVRFHLDLQAKLDASKKRGSSAIEPTRKSVEISNVQMEEKPKSTLTADAISKTKAEPRTKKASKAKAATKTKTKAGTKPKVATKSKATPKSKTATNTKTMPDAPKAKAASKTKSTKK
jgi:hypothetical protein